MPDTYNKIALPVAFVKGKFMENYSIYLNRKLVRDSGKYDIQEEYEMFDKVIRTMNDICAEPCGTFICLHADTEELNFCTDDFMLSVECGVEHIIKFMSEVKKMFPDIEDYMEVKKYEPEGA